MALSKNSLIHSKIKDLLEEGKLHEVFKIIKKEHILSTRPELSDKINRLEVTYKYLIHYFVEGYQDSGREEMLNGIINELNAINDTIVRESMLRDDSGLYFSTKRYENIRKANLASRLSFYKEAYSKSLLASETPSYLEYRKEADDALIELFYYIWTMFGASSQEYGKLVDEIKSPEMPFEFKAQVIAALFLGLMNYYDRNALSALLDIYENDLSQKLSARALVAIILTVAKYPERIKNDNSIKARFLLWQDSLISYTRLREVIMNIVRTRDTERISSKMQNEVMPELMKLRPEILGKLKDFSRDADMEMLEMNPEWEELLNKTGLGDKLRELNEMQLEGGDVMMMAFSNLKNFPFFNSLPNWFLPFSSSHSDVEGKTKDLKQFSELLDLEGVMCDSDKYSFAFSLAVMPEAQRNMMMGKMNEQVSQLKEVLAEKKLKSSVPEFDMEVTRFMRDIYRFYKLFPKKREFYDPFMKPIDFMSLPVLNELLQDEEIIRLVGEFYFKRGYYSEALSLLMVMENKKDDPSLWEKIGYCYNGLNNISEALKWYKKAELINPESLWLIKKLAVCSRMMGKFEEAAEYYSKALAADPENYSLLMSAGNCMLESGNIQGAIANFYHADYVSPDKKSTWRAIAWAELLNKNLEKSLSYYNKLLSDDSPAPNDFLNAGHLFYLSGNIKKAIESYKTCATVQGYSLEKLEEDFVKDMPVIIEAGGKEKELLLILDKIKYDLTNSDK